jgi:hypothetical protein
LVLYRIKNFDPVKTPGGYLGQIGFAKLGLRCGAAAGVISSYILRAFCDSEHFKKIGSQKRYS